MAQRQSIQSLQIFSPQKEEPITVAFRQGLIFIADDQWRVELEQISNMEEIRYLVEKKETDLSISIVAENEKEYAGLANIESATDNRAVLVGTGGLLEM
ncbi:hypothetical protein [Polycladomyces subterraneus]|uniref:Cleavage/polyadenylation specificity factor A subunit N-terminal domain-containing protein n=1 Tax=Polycladomyces subterraneus TaxID=1016997 RepID=A0ABT8IQU1_9BACL|nr:hypothetical protein [Polycladomyces subterraneus]MDN4595137.1 hypothetical protein [Polycladomyces subterraneus]